MSIDMSAPTYRILDTPLAARSICCCTMELKGGREGGREEEGGWEGGRGREGEGGRKGGREREREGGWEKRSEGRCRGRKGEGRKGGRREGGREGGDRERERRERGGQVGGERGVWCRGER